MTILEALKSDEYDLRIDCGDRWLVYDTQGSLWKVYERKYMAKKSMVIIMTPLEENAVRELLKG